MTVHPPTTDSRGAGALTTGQLVARISEDVRELVRDELRLARVETTEKANGLGIGAGMLGAAGLLALYGVGVLLATAILALALALPAWLAGLVVGVALLAVAGVVALVGRKRVAAATPPVPERALAGVREDVAAIRHPR
ncbi:phage holin family protein [Nocardioides sp. SLBN-35]|uniref:phage holin family protein n=1 Tax=Nocardioides sp. SLBN-35 TaxID=2768445 RepID=UPI00114FF2C5|nr:phage holin family protein [Nocardioides sp. SLBN-35]TQK72384.1 putative superfamily III holin-X [Nocardioides sp. SLBN-35]